MATKKRGPGRPEVKRSEDLARRIKSYAAVGVPASDIAKTCSMSETTLRKLYSEELETAAIDATAQVAGKLFQQCMDGNVTAQIFWMKTRGRWSEKSEVEVTSKQGVLVVGGVMSPEEWEQAAKAQQASLQAGDV
ncbi:hypothetical protein [Acidovorax sp. MR-S7]|uniref:hypothetical protein n=1 Tax=Acidovorax sp. MR-S7 TaxID=1268622 RepID=UPI0003A62118|nr:hypothetical protein [Acidovorax sp. MR-S7]GAD20948.1 hypothetical protein AVS7_00709 [Acidovorax sp. MR-S7]